MVLPSTLCFAPAVPLQLRPLVPLLSQPLLRAPPPPPLLLRFAPCARRCLMHPPARAAAACPPAGGGTEKGTPEPNRLAGLSAGPSAHNPDMRRYPDPFVPNTCSVGCHHVGPYI